MNEPIKKIAVLTSGGDAPGMNAAIVAVTKTAVANGWRVIGVEDGYDGLIDGRVIDLTPSTVDDLNREGGTFLRSARSERFRTEKGRAQAARNLAGVTTLVVIGGNGSSRLIVVRITINDFTTLHTLH